jgi:hypothetical protein
LVENSVTRLHLPSIVVAILLGGLGIGAFLHMSSKPHVDVPDYDAVVEFDPVREGGHLLPNLDLLVQGEVNGHPVRFITNSKGFRDRREFGYQPPSGVKRILFLGDSFVDGMRTDQERTIGALLERGLVAEGSQVEVLISGHNNPANAWYYFQEHGFRYHPDLVILGVTLGNDLTWTSYGATLVPEPDDGGQRRLRLVPPMIQADPGNAELLLPDDAYRPRDGWDWYRDREMVLRSRLASASTLFGQCVPPALGPGASRRRHVFAADFFASLCLFYQPLTTDASGMFADIEEVLLGLDRAVNVRGGRLVVVLFPVRLQVSAEDWSLLVRAYSLDSAKFDRDYPNRRLLDFCRMSDIDCLDLTPAFREAHSGNGRPLYRARGDMHFNDAGQALAAAEIAKHVRQL